MTEKESSLVYTKNKIEIEPQGCRVFDTCCNLRSKRHVGTYSYFFGTKYHRWLFIVSYFYKVRGQIIMEIISSNECSSQCTSNNANGSRGTRLLIKIWFLKIKCSGKFVGCFLTLYLAVNRLIAGRKKMHWLSCEDVIIEIMQYLARIKIAHCFVM